ncbi:hypothetical protein TWF751_009578 [Orbilia oligospora]|nr:hypothetical protein TWF751_009578 [Orbilia oligospora]
MTTFGFISFILFFIDNGKISLNSAAYPAEFIMIIDRGKKAKPVVISSNRRKRALTRRRHEALGRITRYKYSGLHR